MDFVKRTVVSRRKPKAGGGSGDAAESKSNTEGRDVALSVFDQIEQDDNGSLSWDEFSSYFQSHGALSGDKPTGPITTSINT